MIPSGRAIRVFRLCQSHPYLPLLSRLLFGAAVAFTTVIALLPKPPALPIDRFGDKFEHSLAFTTLAVLSRITFPQARSLTILERLSFYGALIEVFQAIPSLHRDCDWKDWLTDTITAGLGPAHSRRSAEYCTAGAGWSWGAQLTYRGNADYLPQLA